MSKWFLQFTPEGKLNQAVDQIEVALTSLGIEWVQANHEAKIAAGEFAIDSLRKLIPDYDFRRNIYVQFSSFAIDMPTQILEQGAEQFSKIAAASTIENPSLYVAMGMIGQFLSLFTVMAAAKQARTKQKASLLYISHSRIVNDMIQYVLFYRGGNSLPA